MEQSKIIDTLETYQSWQAKSGQWGWCGGICEVGGERAPVRLVAD